MRELSKEELLDVSGGTVTPTLINSLVKGVTTVLELGRSLGSAIRRALKGTVCPI